MLINFKSDLPCCFHLTWAMNTRLLELDKKISNSLCAKQGGMQSHKEQMLGVQESYLRPSQLVQVVPGPSPEEGCRLKMLPWTWALGQPQWNPQQRLFHYLEGGWSTQHFSHCCLAVPQNCKAKKWKVGTCGCQTTAKNFGGSCWICREKLIQLLWSVQSVWSQGLYRYREKWEREKRDLVIKIGNTTERREERRGKSYFKYLQEENTAMLSVLSL